MQLDSGISVAAAIAEIREDRERWFIDFPIDAVALLNVFGAFK